jgi:uncharacterized protein
MDLFSDTGFVELAGGSATLQKDGEQVVLTGVSASNLYACEQLLAQVPEKTFSILLCHYSDMVEEAAARGVDLYLSGHTHGGQIALPLYGAIITLSRHGKQYESGLYQVGGMDLYVNRGIGMETGHAPRVRFLARPEVTVFDIVPK